MVEIKYNGIVNQISKNSSFYDASKTFGIKNPLAVKVNDDIISLSEKIKTSNEVDFITVDKFYGKGIYKSGLQFIFQVAIKSLFDNSDVSYKHSVPGGMLAEVMTKNSLGTEDVTLIENKMNEIINQDKEFRKITIRKNEILNYYKENKELEKYQNVSRITDKAVTLYELIGHFNYFYSEMPYSTSVINNYQIIYLGDNRFVLLFPNGNSEQNGNKYDHHSGIIENFIMNKNWLKDMKLEYISNVNDLVGCGSIKKIIDSSELKFSLDIYKIADLVLENKKIKFIMISGPSSSGKTTTTERLGEYLFSKGIDPVIISSDDYFIDREKLKKNEYGEYNFEGIEAVDVTYLNNDIHKLLRGESINLPTYNFITGKKELSSNTLKLKENSILLIEGIHSLNDDLVPNISSDEKYKIYLSPFLPINIDRHNYVSTLDLRLLRRIVRDNRSRGYLCADTIHNWRKVRAGEEKNIFPFIYTADYIVNSSLVYEIGVLKPYVEPLLLSVSEESEYYMEARRLINFMKPFFPITSEYVPEKSILREFIGGKND